MKKLLAILLCLLLLPMCVAAQEEESSAYGYVARLVCSENTSFDVPVAPEFITIADKETAEQYLEMGLIAYYEVNCPVYLPDAVETEPGGVSLLSADSYWQHTAVNLQNMTGRGITVGVLDSGVSPHTAFGSRLLTGYNVLTDTTDTVDNIGHGTRVAGMVAADTIGTAPGASIYPIKCFDLEVTTEGKTVVAGPTLAQLLAAMENGIQNGCDILNMSLGFLGFSTTTPYQSFADMLAYANECGVLVVSAVGNTGNGDNAINYPAGLNGVIGVGAVAQGSTEGTYSRAYYSQHNETVDIVAPGSCIGSTDKDSETDFVTTSDTTNVNGTSFASPIVAGILALGLAYKPDLDPYVVADALLVSSRDLGAAGWDEEYGFGLADVSAFLEELDKSGETRVTRSAIYTNDDDSVQEGITVYNAGTAPLTLYGAAYEEGEARCLTSFASLPMEPGYNVVAISELLVYLFDTLTPVMTPMDFRTATAAAALEDTPSDPGMEIFYQTP